MGAKGSTANGNAGEGVTASDARSRALSTSAGTSDNENGSTVGLLRSASQGGASNGTHSGDRTRTRSLSSVPGHANGTTLSIPALLSRATGATGRFSGASGAGSEGEGSSPDEFILDGNLSSLTLGRVFAAHSPFWSFNSSVKCPRCSKVVLPDDVEFHLVICYSKPRINYNEDVLSENKGECVICLEDLVQGDTIARLPCLCIYHKACIDRWFEVNRSCPEHPCD